MRNHRVIIGNVVAVSDAAGARWRIIRQSKYTSHIIVIKMACKHHLASRCVLAMGSQHLWGKTRLESSIPVKFKLTTFYLRGA